MGVDIWAVCVVELLEVGRMHWSERVIVSWGEREEKGGEMRMKSGGEKEKERENLSTARERERED